MKPITAPITTASAPDVVGNLQDAMLFMLQLTALDMSEADRAGMRAAVEAERPRGEFGRRTTKALNVLQDNLHLPHTTQVDEGTAEAFNRVLRAAGAFDAQNELRPFVVSGRVRGADGATLAGLRVRAFHETTAAAIRLGEDTTDAEGRYTIKYELLPNVPSVLLRVAVTRDEVHVIGSDVVRDARPVEVIDLTAPLTAPAGLKRRIEGRVVFEHGLAADGIKLRLFRHEFGGAAPVSLLETVTGEEGTYQFTYDAGDTSLSLRICAEDAAGVEVPLTEVLHGLATEEVAYLNLAAPASLRPLASEFARMETDFTPHFADMAKLAESRENEERQDFTLLNAATGWDARLIALASKAARVSKESNVGLTQPVLYGLFRAGLPSDATQLAQVSKDTLTRALTKAKDAGIVDLTANDVTDAETAFGKLQQTRLSATVPGSQATYASLLTAADLTAGAADRFADVYLNHGGSAEELWTKAAAAGVGEADIVKLQRQGKLAFLTRSEAMSTHLQKGLAITDPVQLVDHGLYDAAKWKMEAEAIAAGDTAKLKALIPPGYQGDTLDDSLKLYAEDMARKVRVTYPTQVVAHQIEQDATDAFQLGDARAETGALLKDAAARGFKLGETTLDTFMRRNPSVLDGAPAAPVQAAIRKLQRVYQMTPSDAAMPVLLKLGFTSAFDVVAMPEEVFLARHGADFPSLEQARLVYRKARQVSSVTHNLFTIARRLSSDPPLYGISAPAEVRDGVRQELIKQFPTLESLFGSMDYCECEHCRSVLSPAAYMVDLLQFIDTDAPAWNSFLSDWKKRRGGDDYTARYKKPYDALVERRPDLPHIALTCENTHTTLPYIDVVNEILEYYVAHGALEAKAARDTVDISTAQLLAEPQNVIAEAYEKLQAAVYPLDLPFDLWLETVRSFASYLETPLAQILEVFRPGDELFMPGRGYDRAAIACESLGLSPAEAAIFAAPPVTAWFELYGFAKVSDATTPAIDSATNQRTDLNSAKALARRLRITYKELVEILQTAFVNPHLARLVTLHKLRISVHEVLFYRTHKADYDANKDLLGKDRSSLGAADQARFDAIDRKGWEALADMQGFEQRLDALAVEYAPWAFDAREWLDAALAAKAFDDVLLLADPQASVDFEQATLGYGFRDDEDKRPADGVAFLRINLFVRLWRKLGWTIEEIDRALCVLSPPIDPFDATAPLRSALINLARLKALDERFALGKGGRLRLLTLWSPLSTDGRRPLYSQLFLQTGRDDVFDDPLGRHLAPESVKAIAEARTHRVFVEDLPASDKVDPVLLAAHPRVSVSYDALQQVQHLGYVGVLTNADKAILAPLSPSSRWPALLDAVQQRAAEFFLVKGHLPAIQGALTLSAEEVTAVLRHRGDTIDTAPLTLDNLSLLYRYRLLASALKMSVADVIALEQLSGLDPFHPPHPKSMDSLDDDHLFTKTLRFIDIAQQVAESGFRIEDLDYLLRHRFDPMGKYRPNTAAGPALFKALGDGIDAIAIEHPTPVDAASATEDLLRQTLGVLLPPDVVERTLRGLSGTSADQMRPTFDTYLKKQRLSGDTQGGALDEEDFEKLFAALTPLEKIGPGDTPAQVKAKEAANEKIASDNEAGLMTRRFRLASAFRPMVRQRLTRELVVQALSAHLAVDRALVEPLATDTRLLRLTEGAAAMTILDALRGAGDRGFTAGYYNVTDASGDPDALLIVDGADTGIIRDGKLLRPAAAQSARFDAFIEVPSTGSYRFSISFESAGQSGELRFAHRPGWSLSGTAAAGALEIGESLELQAGVPNRITLTLRDLDATGARLLVQGETVPRGDVGRLTARPAASLDRATVALTLLGKAVQLLQTLSLREREARYVAAHSADFDGVDFSALPTVEQSDGRASFGQFLRLSAYAALKRTVAGGTEALVDLFEAADETAAYALLARLTRREARQVKTLARALSIGHPFTDERPVLRLRQGLSIVERLGVPAASIVSWTRIVSTGLTPLQRQGIARDLRETVKARFDQETWQRVAQPIFDGLRQRKRDALVAHVMHQHGFARLEQVYEYFLVDPGMEPVVRTSRIRLATSSIQLFIQRCLLNLEKHVHPSAIDADQWLWMKAYRPWEANRKIFLFPENWLEPEFRDDKTHLFRELEGNLLQGDVSSDLVEDVLLQYLRKLNELARLEIVAMHLESNPDAARNRLHVVGRTFGEPHKYFYRTYAHQMWAPWEPITADISSDHLAPVVWRDRLFLFWVTFMEVPPRNAPPSGNTRMDVGAIVSAKQFTSGKPPIEAIGGPPAKKDPTFNQMTLDQLSNGVLSSVSSFVDVQVQLHWSEYARGEWTTRESGGVASSFVVSVPFGFEPQMVPVHVSKDREGDEDRAVYIHLGGPVRRAFKLAGRNSAPASVSAGNAPLNPYNARNVRGTRFTGSGGLKVTLNRRITVTNGKSVPAPETLDVLASTEPFMVLACDNDIDFGTPEIASLVKPLFYQDSTHTYYVEPNLEEHTIEEWKDWVVRTPQPDVGGSLSNWRDPIKHLPDKPKVKVPQLIDPGNPVWAQPIARGSMFTVKTEQDWIVNAGTGVLFDGEVIGPTGRAGLAVLSKADAVGAVQRGAVPVEIQPGLELPADAGVFRLPDRAGSLRDRDLLMVAPDAGMTIVGGGGMSEVLEQNIGRLNRATRLTGVGLAGRINR